MDRARMLDFIFKELPFMDIYFENIHFFHGKLWLPYTIHMKQVFGGQMLFLIWMGNKH